MGADTSHKQDQMVRRTEPKSQDIYLRLLVKLCRLLARRTGSTFSHIVSKRVFVSPASGGLCPSPKMIRRMKLPGREEKTAMVVGTVTDEVSAQKVPELKVWAVVPKPDPQSRGQGSGL